MSQLTLDLSRSDAEDIYLVLNAERYGLDSEPGEPFTMEMRSLLKAMATIGYWPVDFGEANNTHVTLWLRFQPSVALAQTEHFIRKGGDV